MQISAHSEAITVGDITNNSGVAIGPGARATVQYYLFLDRLPQGKPYLAPSLPPHHIVRHGVLQTLKPLLCAGTESRIALRGMGGVGKTTIAIALCHDQEILASFPDGVFWATLGPEPNVLAVQAAWADEPKADVSALPTVDARALRLRSLLHDKHCLLVLDDLWDANSLDLMAVGGPACITLVTTRERKIAQEVDFVKD